MGAHEVKVLDESYEATIEIRRTRVTKTANERGHFDDPAQTSKGILTEVKVAATDLQVLKVRLKQHIDLVDE